jgi:S-adenosylmethionine:tRNA ribosyltransferase-isomerase
LSAVQLRAFSEAHEPPEAREGLRDSVRLLVSSRRTGSVVHGCFRDLPRLLAAGDLLVVNTSATLAAAVPATRADGAQLELRFSTPAPGRDPDTDWIVEQPFGAVTADDELALPAGATARIVAAYAAPRLWLARLELQQAVATYLAEHGHAIRYRHVPQRWPLSAYQTVYAAEPGSAESAEMPSARSRPR